MNKSEILEQAVAVLRALAEDDQTPPSDLERAALDVCDAYEDFIKETNRKVRS